MNKPVMWTNSGNEYRHFKSLGVIKANRWLYLKKESKFHMLPPITHFDNLRDGLINPKYVLDNHLKEYVLSKPLNLHELIYGDFLGIQINQSNKNLHIYVPDYFFNDTNTVEDLVEYFMTYTEHDIWKKLPFSVILLVKWIGKDLLDIYNDIFDGERLMGQAVYDSQSNSFLDSTQTEKLFQDFNITMPPQLGAGVCTENFLLKSLLWYTSHFSSNHPTAGLLIHFPSQNKKTQCLQFLHMDYDIFYPTEM